MYFLGEAPTVTEAGFSKYIYGIFGNNYSITGYYSTELNYNVEVTSRLFAINKRTSREKTCLIIGDTPILFSSSKLNWNSKDFFHSKIFIIYYFTKNTSLYVHILSNILPKLKFPSGESTLVTQINFWKTHPIFSKFKFSGLFWITHEIRMEIHSV